MLKRLGAEYYDQSDDLNALQLRLAEVVKEQMTNWKTQDNEKIKYLVRMCVIGELNRIEERKQTRRDQKAIDAKNRLKREQERIEKENSAVVSLNKSQLSPSKKNVDFDKSQTSSPYGRSPTKKTGYGEGSDVDT
jgi:hypothetical protein